MPTPTKTQCGGCDSRLNPSIESRVSVAGLCGCCLRTIAPGCGDAPQKSGPVQRFGGRLIINSPGLAPWRCDDCIAAPTLPFGAPPPPARTPR